MTKKILFFPLNSPGHVNSSLGIADRLKQDFNYETVFLVIGDCIGTAITDHGHQLITLVEPHPHEDYLIESDEDTSIPVDEAQKARQGKQKLKFPGSKKWPQILARCSHFVRMDPLESFIKTLDSFEKIMLDDLMANSDNCKKAVAEIKPDLIVVDSYFIPAPIVTYKHCPWVKLFSANPLSMFEPGPCLPDEVRIPAMLGTRLYTKSERERMRSEEPEKWEAIVREWGRASKLMFEAVCGTGFEFKEYLERENCPPVPWGKQTHDSPHLNLYMFPKELDFYQDDDILSCPPRWFRCDSLLRDIKNLNNQEKEALKEWEAKYDKAMVGKKRSIFFSLGSIASGDHRIMKKYVDTLAKDKNTLYVFSKGIYGHKYELNADNMIGGNYIPQTLFLQKVDMAIIHGGNNSVTECLYFGLPLIVLPAFADQIDNAQRIEDLGLGKRLNCYNIDEDAIFKAVDEILANEELQERCKKIGQQMRARNDAVKASLILRKLVEDGQLEQSFIDDIRDKNSDEIQWQ